MGWLRQPPRASRSIWGVAPATRRKALFIWQRLNASTLWRRPRRFDCRCWFPRRLATFGLPAPSLCDILCHHTPAISQLEQPMRILSRYVLFDLLKVFLLTLTGLTLLIFIVLIGKEAVDKNIGLLALARMA